MSRAMPSISVVIPLCDGGDAFGHLCTHLSLLQQRYPIEVLVIDSGSEDGSPDHAREAGLRVHDIEPSEFGHGRTRNLAARMVDGDVICFLPR
jgi:rhamnosyltransferase